MSKELCDQCRVLIEGPSTAEPHDRLHSFGVSQVFADTNTDFYECVDCGTKFKRVEAKPSGAVTWTRLP
jgi:hypothetical protein